MHAVNEINGMLPTLRAIVDHRGFNATLFFRGELIHVKLSNKYKSLSFADASPVSLKRTLKKYFKINLT